MFARIFMAFFIGLCLSVEAQERYEFYSGVRSQGMGGAAVAVVNDETALLVNPAALGRLRDHYITVADPELSLGSVAQTVVGLDYMAMMDPQKALAKTNARPDMHVHEKAQLFPSIVVPNFGFGVFAKYEINTETVSADNIFKYDYTNDYAGVFGFNLRFFGGIIKIGANGRFINRVEIRRDDIPDNSTGLTLSGLASEGIGVGSDVGLIIAAPVVLLPTLAVVYRDAGRTSYTIRDGLFSTTAERPRSTPETVDVGLAINPIHSNGTRSVWTVEARDVMTYSDDPRAMRRLHGGMELNFSDAVFIRAGVNQMAWTAGFELAVGNYQFQAATYGEDIGGDDEARIDRRYTAKFSIRF